MNRAFLCIATCVVILAAGAMPALAGDLRAAYGAYERQCAGWECELAKFCAKKKNHELAARHYRAALDLDGGNAAAAKELAASEGKASTPFDEKSQAEYDAEAADAKRQRAAALVKLAGQYADDKHPYRAYTLLQQAAALDGDNAEAAARLTALEAETEETRKQIKENAIRGTAEAVAFDKSIAGIAFYARFPGVYNTKENWPLLIHLHGAGDNGENACHYHLRIREEGGYITAAPTLAWTKPESMTQADFERDARDLLSMIDHLIEFYSVDPRRVILISHSAGGNMLYRYISRHDDVIAAYIAFNSVYQSTPFAKQKTPSRKPILLVEGTKDFNRGITRQAEAALKKAGYANVTYRDAEGLEHNDINKAEGIFAVWLKANCPNPNIAPDWEPTEETE